MRWMLIVVLALMPGLAQAQYTGLSAYAAMHPRFPCDDYLNLVSAADNPAMAIIWDSSFGNDQTCAARFLEANQLRPHAIEIHLLNNVCFRNHSCEPGDFWQHESVKSFNQKLEQRDQVVLQSIADRLDLIRDFLEEYGNVNTQVILSTGLEDNYSSKAYAVLVKFVKERWPWLIVRSPEGTSRERGLANFGEGHGTATCGARSQIANNDGTVMNRAKVTSFLRRNSNCFVRFGWDAAGQGRPGKDGRGVFPRYQRSFGFANWWDEVLGGL